MEQAKPQSSDDEILSPADAAARDFEQFLPRFNAKLEELTNRQLKRVIAAWMEYPFGQEMPGLSYRQEWELFELGVALFNAKHVMVRAMENQPPEDLDQLELDAQADPYRTMPAEGSAEPTPQREIKDEQGSQGNEGNPEPSAQ